MFLDGLRNLRGCAVIDHLDHHIGAIKFCFGAVNSFLFNGINCITDACRTAGIRDAVDAIEQEGINRAKTELDSADMVIEVIDDSAPAQVAQPIEEQRRPVIRVLNKIDLSGRPPGRLSSDSIKVESDQTAAGVSRADANTIT